MSQTMERELTCVVSGPFSHFDLLQATAGYLEHGHYRVLKPEPAHIVDPSADFQILTTDSPDDSPRSLELGYLQAIGEADFHLIYNSNGGRIGLSAAAEAAFAILAGKPSIATFSSPSRSLGAQSIGRSYPDIWFSDEVSIHEQEAIERNLSGMGFAIMAAGIERERIKRLIDRKKPLTRNHPDFLVLSRLVGRLLHSLPASK